MQPVYKYTTYEGGDLDMDPQDQNQPFAPGADPNAPVTTPPADEGLPAENPQPEPQAPEVPQQPEMPGTEGTGDENTGGAAPAA